MQFGSSEAMAIAALGAAVLLVVRMRQRPPARFFRPDRAVPTGYNGNQRLVAAMPGGGRVRYSSGSELFNARGGQSMYSDTQHGTF